MAKTTIIQEWVLEGQNELLVNVLTLTFSNVNPLTSKAQKDVVGSIMDFEKNGSASKPKDNARMQLIIATELMDTKIRTFVERQTESKRKFEDTSRNTQNQQQNKRQNTGRDYTIGTGEMKAIWGI
ncbi:hypothetical protein Tco_0723649 [Tanacetum coccineum]